MLRKLIMRQVAGTKEGSMANSFRMRRMKFFEERFAETFSGEISGGHLVKVLDVGGTWSFWRSMHFRYFENIDLTLLNLREVELPDGLSNVKSVAGDARDLSQYSDKEFDLVFSNSVIEHVGHEPEQQKMADEIRRVGRHYYVQTPNKFFPIEPHFLWPPYFQFLPLSVKIFLISHFSLGNFRKAATREEAKRLAESADLLTKSRLQKFFPDTEIQREKFLFMTKSFYLYV